MFYPTKLLIASSLVLLSDRGGFWDPDSLSSATEEMTDGDFLPVSFDEMENKRVLLLVHGYDNTADEALEHYQTVQKSLDPFDLYDVMIGYLWPGYDKGDDYFKAEKNTQTFQLSYIEKR